jgi:hypothetical protein
LHFPGSSYADALKYSHCMRSHGVVDFPDPSANGDFSFGSEVGEGSAQLRAANKTCEKLMPNGGQPTAAQEAEFTAQALKFSRCMQAYRVDLELVVCSTGFTAQSATFAELLGLQGGEGATRPDGTATVGHR